MAAKALVQTRIDADVKEQATVVLENMGLTVSDAVRILLTRIAREGALPFDFAVDPAVHDAADWVAMVTDNRAYHAEFPVFRFTDTAWLVTLANLVWDRAKILDP